MGAQSRVELKGGVPAAVRVEPDEVAGGHATESVEPDEGVQVTREDEELAVG